MSVTILFFGQLAEMAGNDRMELKGIKDTNELQKTLHAKFPDLEKTKYRIAVNKEIISDTASLQNGTTVALLPPFSGG